MQLRLLTLVGLVQLSRAAAEDAFSWSSLESTTAYRSLGSILASCALTLLICLWHAVHPPLVLPLTLPFCLRLCLRPYITLDLRLPFPDYHQRVYVFLYRVYLMGFAFFVPELLVARACNEWYLAREMKQRFHSPSLTQFPNHPLLNNSQTWWTKTHSYFVVMGGFALYEDAGSREDTHTGKDVDKGKGADPGKDAQPTDADPEKDAGSERGPSITELDEEGLVLLLNERRISNPVFTEDDIKDKSASDGLAKGILAIQLFWFATQLVARHFKGYSVTLIELDTVCIALFTFLLIFFWWDKPYCAQRPHVFRARDLKGPTDSKVKSDEGEDLEATLPPLTSKRGPWDLLALTTKESEAPYPSYLVYIVWSLLGALHLFAWNYDFQTLSKRKLWRLASLILAGSPLLFFLVEKMTKRVIQDEKSWVHKVRKGLTYLVAGVTRAYLVYAMLDSLSFLPPSSYQTVSWTSYIPHL